MSPCSRGLIDKLSLAYFVKKYLAIQGIFNVHYKAPGPYPDFGPYSLSLPVPVAARSKALVCGRSPAEIVGSNPTGGMEVCLLRVLSGRGLCDELITRPEESYRLWCVVVCDLETS